MFFEPARLDVAHFDAGAGNIILLLRGGLAIFTTLALGISVFFRSTQRAQLFVLVVALLVVPTFLWSCLGLERWAPGYSEPAFSALLHRYFDHQPTTTRDVASALGPPLFTGTRSSGETVWSYSYMPSSGFGWHKRVFWFQDGIVTYAYSMNEP